MMRNKAHKDHIIKRIIASKKPAMVALKNALVGFTAVLGAISIIYCLDSFSPENIYRKDFIQEYLLAKAARNGIDPYIAVSELANRLIGPLSNLVFPHPTPHPPPVALLSLPLAWLSYQQAAIAWFTFELACIALTIFWLLRWLRRPHTMVHVVFVSLLALAWSAFRIELATGQLMALNLMLLTGSWIMIRNGKGLRGGALLGSAVALKLLAWPLVVILALRRNWRAAGAAAAVLVATNVTASLWLGCRTTMDYYLKVGPLVSSLYRSDVHNSSLWSVGWRVFYGTGSKVQWGMTALAPTHALELASIAAIITPLVLLAAGMYFAYRTSNFDFAFGIMTCVVLVISPVMWHHYLVLTAIPMAIVVKSLLDRGLPRLETNLTVMAVIFLVIPASTLSNAMNQFFDPASTLSDFSLVLFSATLVSLVPTVAILELMWLLYRLDQLAAPRLSSGKIFRCHRLPQLSIFGAFTLIKDCISKYTREP